MLHTRHAPAEDALELAPGATLALARAHEIAGPARTALALLIAGRTAGPVLWLQPAWEPSRPMGDGVCAMLDPGRLLLARGRRMVDLLWSAEEALRSGEVPLVVALLPEPPSGLTPVRRLHLAAEAGARAGAPPIMLLLLPGEGQAAGVESRWHVAPAPGWARDGIPRWRLARTRSRMAPEKSWEMRLDHGLLGFEALPHAAAMADDARMPPLRSDAAGACMAAARCAEAG